MEVEQESLEGVTMKNNSSNFLNPLPSASRVITINEEKLSTSGSRRRRRTKEQAKGKRVEEIPNGRERTDKMTQHYSTLRFVVPNLSPKATKDRIVEETITYIKKLEQDLKSLQERKAKMEVMAQETTDVLTHQNSSIEVTVSGNIALFGIRTLMVKLQSTVVMEKIFWVFEEQKAEVLTANVAVEDQMLMLTITAVVNGDGDADSKIIVERIKGYLSLLTF